MSLLQSLVDATAQAWPTDAKRVAAVRAAITAARLDAAHLTLAGRIVVGDAEVDLMRLKDAAQLASAELEALVAEAEMGTVAAEPPSPEVLAALSAVIEVIGEVLDRAARDNAVPCPECGHALEAHNRRGCQVAGQNCPCYLRPLTYSILAERRRHGLPAHFNRWDYRPRPGRPGAS